MDRIHPDLERLAFPIQLLELLPGNPRKGDVEAVARSYQTFGQRKPIVVRRQGEGGIVIAGNHQLQAAKKLGWDRIAVVFVDDDDMTAKAFALADNHTADLGSYDEDLLAAMIDDVSVRADLLAATGYGARDVETIAEEVAPEEEAPENDLWGVVITCDNEQQQVEMLERLAGEGYECRSVMS